MEKINILGTGSAMVTKCYNTCFTISNNDEYFLIDAGGGNGILVNLEKSNISINKIHNVFISHSHNDHIMGIVWIIRAIAQNIINDKYIGNLNIFCEKKVLSSIKIISNLVLQSKFTDYFDKKIIFHEIEDNKFYNIMGYDVHFFNIHSTKLKQYGFTTILNNNKKITFLGDEPYNDLVFKYANNSDFLLHEAFCLYNDKDIFKPYEKHHATVKDAAINASNLNAKNLILYHTEDKTIISRKVKYTKEASLYFKGNIYVPEDLDVINL